MKMTLEQAIEQKFYKLESEYFTIGNIPASELAKIAADAAREWELAQVRELEAVRGEIKLTGGRVRR